ncbi:MAG: ABC transporter permease [Prevotella sp.]|nr:ABC transporter permease [Prevotella sp.]MCM1075021.1 ABC transporter permease [Ruminococcus sp.]
MKKILNAISIWFRALGESFALEWKHIWKDQGVVLFFLFLPLAYPVIYSLIYNPELVRDVPVVVVDNDKTALSRELTRNFDATQGAHIIGYAADMSEARQALNEHACYAIMEIPHGFERNIGRGGASKAMLYCDMSLLLRYRSLLFSATDLSLAMSAKIQAADIKDLGAASVMAKTDPMPIRAASLGNLQSGFDSFIMPGVLILILQQCIVLAVGMMGGGRFETARKGINPVNAIGGSTFVSMIGRMACYIAILALPIIWLTHFVPLVFKFPMAGDMLDIFCFLLPIVLASISIGFIVQCFTTEREAIMLIWVATSVLFLFLSGLTWPRYAMPEGWKFISDLIPATWGVNGFILMNANGASITDVAPFYHNLWYLTAGYFVVAWALHRFYLRPHLRRLSRK